MRIKVFKAADLKEAMAMVKDELGSDAVILHTKRYKQGGFLGYNSKEVVEVTAAVDDTPRRPRTAAPRTRRSAATPNAPKQPARQKAPAPPRTVLAQYKTAGTEEAVSLARSAAQDRARIEEEPFVPMAPEPILHVPVQDAPTGRRAAEPPRLEPPQRAEQMPAREDYGRAADMMSAPVAGRPEQSAYAPRTIMDPSMYAEPILSPRRPEPVPKPQEAAPRIIRPKHIKPKEQRREAPPAEAPATETKVADERAASAEAAERKTSEPMPPVSKEKPEAAPVPDEGHQAKINALEDELAQMRQMLRQVMNQPSGSEEGATLKDALRAQELREDVMQDMIRKIPPAMMLLDKGSPEAVKALGDYLHGTLRTADGIGLRAGRPKIVTLIGTTGVGKTTTIAKIAAKFALEKRVSEIALIAADNYRIAAVEQLKTYSDILQLPLEVVFTAAELKDKLRRHRDKKLILIDTAGRSQNNEYQMNELKEFLAAEPSIEKHLVLSATTKERDAEAIFERFSFCRPDRILLTKTDETENIGFIVNLLFDRRLALSYFTNGQSVPDDIEPAKPEALARLMLR